MKYTLLTKEQLENLNEEFAKFLAVQQIDVKDWKSIKINQPNVVQKELELFSDLVWEDVLTKTKYMEHFSEHQLDLFNCGASGIHRIVIKVSKLNFDFLKKEDFNWFLENLNHNSFTYYQAQKKYQKERNLELFSLIQKGGILTKGKLYKNILLQIK